MKQYKVVTVKYGTSSSKNYARMEEEFNRLGKEGWIYKGQAGTGAYFIFEKDV